MECVMNLTEIKNLINEGYKEVKQKFYQQADKTEVDKLIDVFRDLVNRNQLQGNEKNIDWWGKQGFEKFKEKVEFQASQKSQTELKKSKTTGKQIFLAENNDWLIVIPLDKDASCFYGKNTSWCTTKPFQGYFENYFYDESVTLIYFIRKSDGNKWAIAVSKNATQYFDINDTELDNDFTFKQQTGLNPNPFIKLAKEKSPTIEKSRDTYKSFKYTVRLEIEKIKHGSEERNEKIEQALFTIKDRDLIGDYLWHVGGKQEYPLNFQKLMVNLSPTFFQYIKNPSEKIKAMAVKTAGTSIQYMDNPSPEIQMLAVENTQAAFKYIPLQIASPEVVKYQLQQNPDSLRTLLDDDDFEVTQEMVDIAADTDEGLGRMIIKIPQNLLSERHYLDTVKKSPSIYPLIPDEYKNKKEFMIAAVDEAYMYASKNILEMNPDLIDEDVIKAAMNNNDANLSSIFVSFMHLNKDQMETLRKIFQDRMLRYKD